MLGGGMLGVVNSAKVDLATEVDLATNSAEVNLATEMDLAAKVDLATRVVVMVVEQVVVAMAVVAMAVEGTVVEEEMVVMVVLYCNENYRCLKGSCNKNRH